jgi:hypothetical protein
MVYIWPKRGPCVGTWASLHCRGQANYLRVAKNGLMTSNVYDEVKIIMFLFIYSKSLPYLQRGQLFVVGNSNQWTDFLANC